MKRVAVPSRSSKSDNTIVLDDADEPPVKREAEEPASSLEVAELRQQLKQSEEKFQKLCDLARRDKEALKAKVDYLENLVDTKDDILKNASKASVEDELKKKLGEVTKELENERKRSTALQHKLDQIAQVLQTPPILMSGPDLDAATGSLGSLQRRVLSDVVPAGLPQQLQPAVQSRNVYSSEEGDAGHWEISCICGQKEDDDEKMVACDQCKFRWEHIDCIFPVTKQLPSGKYLCHVCYPRPTDLTREQARAYQDRVAAQKEGQNSMDVKRKLAERAKTWKENSRKQSSSGIGSTPFRELQKNEYSNNAKRLITVSRSPGGPPADVEIIKSLRSSPRARSVVVEERTQGLFTNQNIPRGAYIAELCGYVCLQSEPPNRKVTPGQWLNDCTFLFEKNGENLIVDARRMGNVARYVRRSCKPNAELKEIMSGSELHVMIKAIDGVEIRKMQEVSIKFEDDWKQHPRPAQGCTCKGGELKTCEIELFFNKAPQVTKEKSKKPAKKN